MKIGVLTFHSQLNYGGVLQCWALVQTLRNLGHDVVVIDRWLTEDNRMLNGPFGLTSVGGWLNIMIHAIAGCGGWSRVVRHWRTRKFVRAMGLTDYHFYDWKDAPADLDVDCIVVGSDQVWHGGDWAWPTPGPYLLENAPVVKAIAYAASFGMKKLPSGVDYLSGFKRFAAISVREREAFNLVRKCGVDATHVVDPTLLLEKEQWNNLILGTRKSAKRKMVCYFISNDVEVFVSEICSWARQNNVEVKLLGFSRERAFPKSLKTVYINLKDAYQLRFGNVRACGEYGPREFVRAFSDADYCLTDSFHAVMFSFMYGCDLRFILPDSSGRQCMFARVKEFASNYISGPVFSKNVLEALRSLSSGRMVQYDYHGVKAWSDASRQWIVKHL